MLVIVRAQLTVFDRRLIQQRRHDDGSRDTSANSIAVLESELVNLTVKVNLAYWKLVQLDMNVRGHFYVDAYGWSIVVVLSCYIEQCSQCV